MQKSIRYMLGATLLEVMLVLAIIGLIILMSVRYYQSASTSNQVEAVLEAVQSITATAENIGGPGTPGYTASQITASSLKGVGGTTILNGPFGGIISVTGVTSSTYTVTIPNVVAQPCTGASVKLKASNTKYTGFSCAGTALSYTYNSAN